MNVLALVDGEHYPSVSRWGLEVAAERGFTVMAVIMVGGAEKLPATGDLQLGDVAVIHGGGDPASALGDAIRAHRPGGVLDLSDEPVLSYERRMQLVAVALAAGVPYIGADFRFDPPITGPPLAVPTVGVIGTGKRVGKTAVSAHLARLATANGVRPIVVAMGRGGPPEPAAAAVVDTELSALLARVERGEHAASDFLEDALMAGVPTVGARRCGGGLAGRPFVTNVEEAAALAASSSPDLVVLEGSGASVPTLPWDAGILVLPANLPTEHLEGYFGPYRVLLSDVAVFMMEVGSFTGPENLSTLDPLIRRLHAGIQVAVAELQPVPMADVKGKDAFFATTATQWLAERQAARLEKTAECRVVATSSHLADRTSLQHDLASAPEFDVLLTELKGAAVDVAAQRALERGAEVVFVDNRPMAVGGDAPLDDLLRGVVSEARHRADRRLSRAE
ncbi:MAG TPA: 2,3-diphosphoglycerate synthetase [Actinomycetota bacterium]|jgi:cyclic 2,3-diphosphoglycerate synthetase